MSTNNHPFLDQLLQTKPSFLTMGKTVKWQPNSIEAAPNCPRCFSTNTKFCYYNNYSISQPRYFCKGCRRYWTRGGTLRKVPVGGKSRRKSSGSVDVSAAKAKDGDLIKGCDEGCSFDQPNKMDGGDCMYEGFGVEGFGGGSEMVWAEQPLMQEFEVFDERLRMWDESLMSGDWGSFDLSAYENL